MPRAAPARSAGSSWDETKHGAMLCPGWGISIIPAELKGSSLRRSLESALYTLIGVMDDASGSTYCQCHVQSAKHQLGGQCRGHRPADDPTAAGIEHDREVEKPRPCRNVGYICHP
jgi:hypothetical protein